MGWKVSANGGAASTVKSGDEVEFKGDGVTVTNTTDETGKHIVTIKAEQPQGGGAAGGSTPVTAGDGISVSANNKVSINAGTGVTVDNNGVSVNTDGKTIEVGADGKVSAKVADNKGLEKTDAGLTVKAGTGVTVDNNGVSVNAKDKGGLTVGTDGVSVKTDGTTIELDTATGNVKAVTGGFKTNATTGATEANDNDGNKLATVTNVANAINDAKVKVTEGNGAKVEHDKATNTYTVSAKVEENKGIVAGANGLSVQGGNGVTVNENGVSVNAKDKGGLTVGTDGVSVTTDNATIKVDAEGKVAAVTGGFTTNAATGDTEANTDDGDKLTTVTNVANAINAAKVKVTEGNGAKVDHNKATNTYTVSAKVEENKGIVAGANGLSVQGGNGVTVNENGVSVNAKDKGGLTVGTDGVSVKTDGTTIELDTATGNVKAVTGAITAGDNAGVADADKGKLAKAGDVVEAINKAKTKIVAGNNIKVTSSGNEYTVSADLPFTKNADKSISLNEEGVIHNVANGRVAKDSKDAVNGGQLHAVESRLSGNMDKLNHRIDKVGKRADAGTASAIATANLLQSYRPGLSAATAAVGQYHGQSAVAVGYSRLSDNGKYGVKFSLGANTQGNVGAGAGVAYFW